jgi:hypothetical protein
MVLARLLYEILALALLYSTNPLLFFSYITIVCSKEIMLCIQRLFVGYA